MDSSLRNNALTAWVECSGNSDVPEQPSRQKSWDGPIIQRTYQNLVEGSVNEVVRARLLGVAGSYSGAWLEAVPVASLGTRLDDEAVRIAVGIRLGSAICEAHACRCSGRVHSNGLHGLDCSKSAGRFARHSELNSIIHKSLSAVNRPSILEPPGMTRHDGRRPDGLPLFP